MNSDWIVDLITRGGYFAVALLMLAENVFPPIPSEVVMPVSGIVAATGSMFLVGVIVAGTAGALAGQFLWYWVGARVGEERLMRWAERHGRWITLSPREIHKVSTWFQTHGSRAVFIGRLIPGIRTFISLPAGLARMPVGRFLLYSLLGSGVWTAALAYAGYALRDRYENVTRFVGPVSSLVIGAIVVLYIWRLVTFTRRAA